MKRSYEMIKVYFFSLLLLVTGKNSDRQMERIEFEPDAELIPDSIPKNSPPVQPQPAVPSVPASPYPGLLPGRKFYFLNGPQFVTYPQIGAPVQ